MVPFYSLCEGTENPKSVKIDQRLCKFVILGCISKMINWVSIFENCLILRN